MSGLTIILAIFLFGIIIFVHELGHLLFAKKYGVYCKEFAVGMGPKLISKKYGETVYSIRLVPIGGFVSLAGEEEDDSDIPFERQLPGISKLKQAMVIFGGAFFNFILGFVIIFSINLYLGEMKYTPEVASVVEDSRAEEIGLTSGYNITNVNGEKVNDKTDIVSVVQNAKETGSLNIVFKKGNDIITFEDSNVNKDFKLGVTYETKTVSRNIGTVLKNTVKDFGAMTVAMIGGFAKLIFNFSSMKTQVGGPVMVISTIGSTAQLGFIYVLQLVAVLSINIGIVNLLPIPGLDGSKILIAVGEHITKRDLPRKLYYALSFGGIVLLLLLMVLITIQDIKNLI